MRKPISARPNPRGFALIVTLSLMILLTVIAVGLLSLSAVSLRSTSQGSAQMEAQANARMALMQAIGELQLELGPDRRINCPAGLDIAKQAMKHESSAVRTSAVNALSSLGGDAVTEEILTFLKSAETKEERIACENALLARIGDPAAASRMGDHLISLRSEASSDLLDSLF